MNKKEFDKFIREFNYNSYPEQSSFVNKLRRHEESRNNISYVKNLFILSLVAGLSYLTYINSSDKKEAESLRSVDAEVIDDLRGDLSGLLKENKLLKIENGKRIACDNIPKSVSLKKKETNSCLKIDKCFYVSHYKNILHCDGYLNGTDFRCKFILESKYRKNIKEWEGFRADDKMTLIKGRVINKNSIFNESESFKIHSVFQITK